MEPARDRYGEKKEDIYRRKGVLCRVRRTRAMTDREQDDLILEQPESTDIRIRIQRLK